MNEPLDIVYYRLALLNAKARNLTEASNYAAHALRLNPENKNAKRLLGICLYERGFLAEAARALENDPLLFKSVARLDSETRKALKQIKTFSAKRKWKKAANAAKKIPHHSVHILNIIGCLCFLANQRGNSVALFQKALRKDRGSDFSLRCLTDVIGRSKLLFFYGR